MVDRNTIIEMVARLRSLSSSIRTGFRKEKCISDLVRKKKSAPKKIPRYATDGGFDQRGSGRCNNKLGGKESSCSPEIKISLKELLYNH